MGMGYRVRGEDGDEEEGLVIGRGEADKGGGGDQTL